MKILVLGHQGMLGHMVKMYLNDFFNVEIVEGRFPDEKFKREVIESESDYLINCIGAIPQKTSSFSINKELPVWLDQNFRGKIIHPGTDCEIDNDEYGNSKREASDWIIKNAERTKIIKSSIIGPETRGKKSLMEWFLSNPDGSSVRGYSNHYWNGVTTLEWAKKCRMIVEDWESYGKRTVIGTNCSTKYDILKNINSIYGRNISIQEFLTDSPVDKCLEKDIECGDIKDLIVEMKEFYING